MQSAGQFKRGDYEFSSNFIETNTWTRFGTADFAISRIETAYRGRHPLRARCQSRIPAGSRPLRAARARIGRSREGAGALRRLLRRRRGATWMVPEAGF